MPKAYYYNKEERKWVVFPYAGSSGKSAYDIAVEHGFSGTESEWLDSLKGSGPGGNGATFVPTVKDVPGGYQIVWSNDKGLSNPDPVTIKNGVNGKDAPIPALSVGKVTTLGPEEKATVVMSGPITNRVVDFGIPRGGDGSGSGTPQKGDNGATFTPVVKAVQDGFQITWSNDQGLKNPDPIVLKNGADGVNAPVPAFKVGRVDTLDPGSKATVTMEGPVTNRVINFGIPRGLDGHNTSGGAGAMVVTMTDAAPGKVSIDVPFAEVKAAVQSGRWVTGRYLGDVVLQITHVGPSYLIFGVFPGDYGTDKRDNGFRISWFDDETQTADIECYSTNELFVERYICSDLADTSEKVQITAPKSSIPPVNTFFVMSFANGNTAKSISLHFGGTVYNVVGDATMSAGYEAQFYVLKQDPLGDFEAALLNPDSGVPIRELNESLADYIKSADIPAAASEQTEEVGYNGETKKLMVKPGRNGKDAPTPAISIGKVETLSPTEQATAELVGPITDLLLNLGIPQGKDGGSGDSGSGKFKFDSRIVLEKAANKIVLTEVDGAPISVTNLIVMIKVDHSEQGDTTVNGGVRPTGARGSVVLNELGLKSGQSYDRPHMIWLSAYGSVAKCIETHLNTMADITIDDFGINMWLQRPTTTAVFRLPAENQIQGVEFFGHGVISFGPKTAIRMIGW